jgi:hypothetical protein
MTAHWTKLPTPVGVPLGDWRELPINLGQFDDCTKLHVVAASLCAASAYAAASASGQGPERRYVAGMDILAALDPHCASQSVVRFLPFATLSVPRSSDGLAPTDEKAAEQATMQRLGRELGVPLVPFEHGMRIQFALGACVQRRERRNGERRVSVADRNDRCARVRDWLKVGGLSVDEIELVGEAPRFAMRNKVSLTMIETRVAGTATIRNARDFARLLVSGVGRCRAFGFGLVQYRPV